MFAHKVIGASGAPDVWITEDVRPATEERAAHTERLTWTADKINCRTTWVHLRDIATLYKGVSNRHDPDGVVKGRYDGHAEALQRELRLEAVRHDEAYNDGEPKQEVIFYHFPKYDIRHE